ncbi:unnamed protein product [Heligmosomoides polygyrus]|uniref:GAGA-binding transcriptional activator n=1 Tax=Heligmosomoides polygyrus TaxID=6339 RepID=A0A183FMJ1_HELPZ|nr:unnamed protein product [Heligmosomoides polygyrus]
MDVDPATTISSSGFIPPAVESGLLVIPASNTVDPSFMAQAQLSAAAAAQVQVQAAVNQHQVLVKLIENNSPRVNCTCQCTCRRYPPGCAIVDEVSHSLMMKHLVLNGRNIGSTLAQTRGHKT